MPKGGELRVKASRGDEGLVIEVSDTGEGIPAVVMEDLFKPFQTTKLGGLGLAYCKRAVEAHGGSITVETQVGAGATFTIMLPDA
jgi:signal transduction histidine kinase